MILEPLGLFVFALALILASAVLFTNGVEWLGKRFGLSEGGIGSVLAAVGTALPETIIPMVAIVGMGEADVGIGAILGAPFMLVTLTLPLAATWIILLSVLRRRECVLLLDVSIPKTDLGYFLSAFLPAVALSVVPWPGVKVLGALGLLILYGWYLRRILISGETDDSFIGPLYFWPRGRRPPLWVVLLQVFAALAVMVTGAHLFVDAVRGLAPAFGIKPLILSLLVTPVATELPEKFNSLVWISQRKDNLAVANITGAMVFQSTIPVSIGLIFTPWRLEPNTLACAGIAIGAALAYLMLIRVNGTWKPWQLSTGAVLYAGYAVFVLSR
jgi:cation:H+ antiporter